MSEAAKKLVDAFDALPPDELRNVVREILRSCHDFPSDEELIIAADDVFPDLHSHETLE